MNLTFLLWITLSFLSYQKETFKSVHLQSKQKVDITDAIFASNDLSLINRSKVDIQVSVLNEVDGEQIKGFGLAPYGHVKLSIDQGQTLRLRNEENEEAHIDIELIDKAQSQQTSTSKYIQFTLRNNSLKSIPLIIPDVMNPNLSPLSNSGVSLKIGQKIYFIKNGKKSLLLTVDESIQNGTSIDVAKLIKQNQ